MRRVVNLEIMKQKSNEIINKLEVLENEKGKLLENIDKIVDVYKGEDADLIISKYKERANKIDGIISNYRSYLDYLKTQSYAYSNNIETAKDIFNNEV